MFDGFELERIDYQRAIHDPATVHAMCEDYRAGLGLDRAADDADRAAGRRIACPVLVLWASRGDLSPLYGDVLGIWRNWADDVRGHPSAPVTTSPKRPPTTSPPSSAPSFGVRRPRRRTGTAGPPLPVTRAGSA